MALNLKKLRDLITFSREVPGYSTPGAAEGPDEGSGEGSYSSSLEGSDQGSGEGSMASPRRGPHREATATGRRLLSSIPDMISSGITAAATPNIAGGGWADIFRGAAAGQHAQQQRQVHQFGMRRALNEEARKQADERRKEIDTQSQVESRKALAGYHDSTSAYQNAQLADRVGNEKRQRDLAELQRQATLGAAQAYEVPDQTSQHEIPSIQQGESSLETAPPHFRKPSVGMGPEEAVASSEPPKIHAGLPGTLPGAPPMMASATLPKEKAQPADTYTFDDPTKPGRRLAMPFIKKEAEVPIEAELAALLGLPPGTASIPRKNLGSLITARLKDPKSDPNATLDASTRTAIASFGGDPSKPADVARGRKLVQDDAVAKAAATRQPHETTFMIPDGHGGFTARNIRAGETIPAGAVSPTGVNQINTPTANTRGMAEKAPRVIQFVDRINQLLNENEKQLGPLRGRWSDFTAGKIGLKNKGYTQVSTNADLLSTALMNMHVGSKGGEQMMEHFKKLIEVAKQDPDNLRAALGEIRAYAQTVEAEGNPKGSQAPPPANNAPAEEWVRDASGKLVKK